MQQPSPPPPILLRTRMIYVIAITCHLFGGDGGVNEKFLSILSKNSSLKLENGKGRSSGVPLLDVHGVSYFLVGKQCKQRQ